MQNILLAAADAAAQIFALAFYLVVVGVGLYAAASVIYNLALAHQRRQARRPEPPTARRGPTVYPKEERK